MITVYIEHEEATIQSFIRDTEFSEFLLLYAILEDDLPEAQKVQRRMLEAWRRTQNSHCSIFKNFSRQLAQEYTPVTA